jgi:LPXTG-motif cell wall-anchored protein
VKRSRPMYRRALAVAGSAVIGLIGAAVLASPASAHHTEVKGVPICDTETGEWVVTWTVNSFAPTDAPTFRLIDVVVTPEGSTVSNIVETQGDGFPHRSGAPLTGEQRLPGTATSASLGVQAKWSNGFMEENLKTGAVTFEGTCAKPVGEVEASDASTCDELTVTATNPEDGAATTVTVTTSAGDSEEFDLEPGADHSVSFPGAEGLTYEVIVDGTVIASGGWTDPGECDLKPSIASQPDCDSLTIEVTNPFEDEAIEATVTSGDVTETLTVEPGQTGEITIDAEAGTVATVTAGDTTEEITWTEPANCGGSGGDLPVTGSSTGIVVGAALALLAVGGGLFLVARRRRITFTA